MTSPISMIRRVPSEMRRMMQHLGCKPISQDFAAHPYAADLEMAVTRCRVCVSLVRCRAVLSGHNHANPDRFCPNAHLFRQLAREFGDKDPVVQPS